MQSNDNQQRKRALNDFNRNGKRSSSGTVFKKPTQPQRKAGMKRHSKRQSNGKSTTIQTTGIKRQSTKNRTATKSQSNANRKQSNGNLTARAVENERPRTRDQDKRDQRKENDNDNDNRASGCGRETAGRHGCFVFRAHSIL